MSASPPTRTVRFAAALLLVYPALILIGNVRAFARYGYGWDLAGRLPLVCFLALTSFFLWRGGRRAYATALIASGGLASILVLYDLAVAQAWGREAWKDFSAFDYVLDFLPFVAFGAAFVLLVRDATFGGVRRWALMMSMMALAVELVLMALIATFGVGSPFAGQSWYQSALDVSQAPGSFILVRLGMCCGYENHTIISDWSDPHWGGITMNGIPALVAANALGLVPILVCARSALRRRFSGRATAIA